MVMAISLEIPTFDLPLGLNTSDVFVEGMVYMVYWDAALGSVVVLSFFVLSPNDVMVVHNLRLGCPRCWGLGPVDARSRH